MLNVHATCCTWTKRRQDESDRVRDFRLILNSNRVCEWLQWKQRPMSSAHWIPMSTSLCLLAISSPVAIPPRRRRWTTSDKSHQAPAITRSSHGWLPHAGASVSTLPSTTSRSPLAHRSVLRRQRPGTCWRLTAAAAAGVFAGNTAGSTTRRSTDRRRCVPQTDESVSSTHHAVMSSSSGRWHLTLPFPVTRTSPPRPERYLWSNTQVRESCFKRRRSIGVNRFVAHRPRRLYVYSCMEMRC